MSYKANFLFVTGMYFCLREILQPVNCESMA